MSGFKSGSQKSRTGKGVTLLGVLAHLVPPLAIFLFFAAAGVVHVTSRVLVVDAGYKLSRLENDQRTMARENSKLRLELATLKAPSRLEELARTKLGMAPPPPGSVLTSGATLPKSQARGSPVASRGAP